jgi:hypothetical protein
VDDAQVHAGDLVRIRSVPRFVGFDLDLSGDVDA